MLVRHFCPHYSQVELPKKSVSGQPNNGCGSWGIEIWNQRRGFTLMGMRTLMFLHIKRSLLNVCQWTMGLAGMSVYISIECELSIDYVRFFCKYDGNEMEPLPTVFADKEHIPVFQDESIFHTNEYQCHMWVQDGQQPLKKRGMVMLSMSLTSLLNMADWS